MILFINARNHNDVLKHARENIKYFRYMQKNRQCEIFSYIGTIFELLIFHSINTITLANKFFTRVLLFEGKLEGS